MKLKIYRRKFWRDLAWNITASNGKVINSGNAGFNNRQNLDNNLKLNAQAWEDYRNGVLEVDDTTKK